MILLIDSFEHSALIEFNVDNQKKFNGIKKFSFYNLFYTQNVKYFVF